MKFKEYIEIFETNMKYCEVHCYPHFTEITANIADCNSAYSAYILGYQLAVRGLTGHITSCSTFQQLTIKTDFSVEFMAVVELPNTEHSKVSGFLYGMYKGAEHRAEESERFI